MDPDCLRSSALVPGVELWPSEWSALNRTLLTLPKDVPLLRYLRVRPLSPRHREGLRLLHTRLFPIRYDSRFYDVTCGIAPADDQNISDPWASSEVIGIGLFLPRDVLSKHCDCRDVVCRDSSSASPSSSSEVSEGPSPKEDCEVGDVLDKVISPDGGAASPYTSDGSDRNIDVGSKFLGGPVNYDSDCILNDCTYDSEHDEFLVGFATMLINRSEYSDLVPGEDFFWLEYFFQDMMLPYFQECDLDQCIDRFLNFDAASSDFYHFLYKNLYCDSVMLDYVSRFKLDECRTVYLLSAGVTMGLRSRMLGTHLILFVQGIMYYCAYGVFLYNRDLYHCPDALRVPLLSKLRSVGGPSFLLDLDDVIASEMAVVRLSMESILRSYRRCDVMPLTLYLHVIAYNRKACAMYRRANFVCVTRYDQYYVINSKQYAANVLAYYVYPPCAQ